MSNRICYFCQYRALTITINEGHLRKHTKEKPFFCLRKNCDSSFALQCDLNRHYKKVHKIFKSQKRRRNSYRCFFCSRELRHFSSLATHMLCHTRERPYKCVYAKCRKFSSTITARTHHVLFCEYNPNLKNNIQKQEDFYRNVLLEERFNCYFCLKNFKEKGHFFKHIQWHTGELNVSCFGCKIQFNYRDLWKHQKVCIKSRRLYVCPFCNASKTSTGELNTHIRNVHTKDDAKTKCYFCNVSFPKNIIREHLATHTQEKAYQCRYCSVSFATNRTLWGHIASKHRDTEQGREMRNKSRRNCYFCNKSLASFGCLRNHMACHTMEFLSG